jgi:NAD(P)-dependent dehydrogenase (short-subunit alcohol dehydrogenase family)
MDNCSQGRASATAVARPRGCIINGGSIIPLPRSHQGATIETHRQCRVLEFERRVGRVHRLSTTVHVAMPSLILAEQGSRISDRFKAFSTEHKAHTAHDFSSGRAGEAHEVAALIGFLCSEAASYVTGVWLPMDGGFL